MYSDNYVVYKTSKTYEGAVSACKAEGYTLAEVKSKEEYDWMVKHLNFPWPNYIWVMGPPDTWGDRCIAVTPYYKFPNREPCVWEQPGYVCQKSAGEMLAKQVGMEIEMQI